MFTLAHISDPHLPPLPDIRFADLLGKRVTGWLNWRLRRGAHHNMTAIDALVADLAAMHPDHVAVTGDLVNLSLTPEFEQARKFLERLGTPERVTVIPGNHDAYVAGAAAIFAERWREYLAGDDTAGTPFPFLRRRGPVALIGLSTALPTLPFFATGRLGADQLERLDTLLASLPREQCFRVILIHHPPAGARPWLRRLTDADGFREVIGRHGAELILCGHDHVAARHAIAGPQGAVPVIQVPSASAPFGDRHGAAAYNLYRIAGKPGAWTCEIEAREIDADGAVRSRGKSELSAS
jgi:3',5'-cyclic AMP phosphodiesterase CpdA